MQFRYLVFGLLLAAGIVAFNWVNSLPGIPPVRLANDRTTIGATEGSSADARAPASGRDEPFRLEESTDGQNTEQVVLPLLNDSDPWLREQLEDTKLPWLAESELVRTAATVLENASRGEVPRKFLQFLAPEGRFKVLKMGSLIQVDSQTYERYTPFVRTLELLPPERAAAMFRLAEPLLAESVRELGEAASPRELVFTALGVALDTPRIDAASVLKQPKVVYTYADEELESLKPLQKQLLRMGPQNLQTVRLWLEDFGLALAPGSSSASSASGERLAADGTETESESAIQ